MRTIDLKGRVTRRGFFECSARAFAGAGVFAAINPAKAANTGSMSASNSDLVPVPGKIALEEHFVIPETLNASYGAAGSPEFRLQLEDIAARRIAEMDRGGIEPCIF